MTAPETRWTPQAERRLKKVPFLLRPLVRRRAQAAAAARGLAEITSELLDELKSRDHPGR